VIFADVSINLQAGLTSPEHAFRVQVELIFSFESSNNSFEKQIAFSNAQSPLFPTPRCQYPHLCHSYHHSGHH